MVVLGHLGSVAQYHLQFGTVGWQLEPQATCGHHLWVELNGGGVHAQMFVTKLGECCRAQTELHGMALVHLLDVGEQQPRHHALHIFEVDIKRFVDLHRALHPRRA